MAEPVTLTLPYPPSLSACYKNAARRGRVKTDRYRRWEAHASIATMGKRQMTRGRVHVSIAATPPTKAKRDLDNILKPILDWSKDRLIEDDSLVESLFVKWHREGEPGVTVEVVSA